MFHLLKLIIIPQKTKTAIFTLPWWEKNMNISVHACILHMRMCCFIPVWSWRWSAAETETGGCFGTAVQWWRLTPRRDSPGRWGCGWYWSEPGSGWSWVSLFLPWGPPDPHWRSPGPPWFLAWLNWKRPQLRLTVTWVAVVVWGENPEV